MRDIHAVTHDEDVGALEGTVVRFDRYGAGGLLVEKNASFDAFGAPGGDQILGESQRAAGIQNVVDQDDMTVLNIEIEVPLEATVVVGGDLSFRPTSWKIFRDAA